MKELSIEQKAKAYDEAIERAKQMFSEKELNYLFPELKESDDEKIINLLKMVVEKWHNVGYADYVMDIPKSDIISWLEKQGERANFRNKIQIGDKVTRNKDGVLVNLSQLERIAKPNESKQVEQTSDNIEPKFKIGDFITNGILVGKIDKVHELGYHAYFGNFYSDIPDVENWHKWTIQDAKDGDIIIDPATQYDKESVFIFERIDKDNVVRCYVTLSNMQTLRISNDICNVCGYADKILYTPASKEQRDLLFQKMHEAGYEWDAEKKELRKIKQEQTEFPNGEDYGIDGLYHAIHILEITLGKVDGYQTDDGILEHECAIEAVNRLYKQKPVEWSEEDDKMINSIAVHLNATTSGFPEERAWADKFMIWLKKLKDICQPQPKHDWNEEDEQFKIERKAILNDVIAHLRFLASIEKNKVSLSYIQRDIDWIKENLPFLRPQSQWKPSDEQITWLYRAADDASKDSRMKQVLNNLLLDLKKLREDKL